MKLGLTFKFGEIMHGWFPITLVTKDQELVIDASDIPIDPVLQIIKAIEEVYLYQTVSEVWFSLEPNYYQMIFEPLGEKIKIVVLHVDERYSFTEKTTRVERKTKKIEYVGNRNDILIQTWRSLKELSSRHPEYLRDIAVLEKAVKKI